MNDRTLVLNTDQQTTPRLHGGCYVISTFFNGGTASLEVQLADSSDYASIGTLTAEMQELNLPRDCLLRLTKTGSAKVEVSAWDC